MAEAAAVEVRRQDDFDLYRPGTATGPLPTVVLVHGPAPAGMQPRESPLFAGYATLLAGSGVAAAVVGVRYQGLDGWPPGTVWPPNADFTATAHWLEGVVHRIREAPASDRDRLAIWAFSGGGMLTGGWLAESPPWLRCVALTYPVLADQNPGSNTPAPCDLVRPGRPIVLTRVGRERPEFQATVDRFQARAAAAGAAVEVIDVPDGEHGFDAFVSALDSCPPALAAISSVTKHLAAEPESEALG